MDGARRHRPGAGRAARLRPVDLPRAAPGSPRGRGRRGWKSVERRYATPAEPPVPGLLADRALDHLHVPVAPLLDALVDVDQPLADLGPGRVGAVDLDQAVLHAPARRRPDAREAGVREDTTAYRLEALPWRGAVMPVAARGRRRVVGEHARGRAGRARPRARGTAPTGSRSRARAGRGSSGTRAASSSRGRRPARRPSSGSSGSASSCASAVGGVAGLERRAGGAPPRAAATLNQSS